MKLLLARPNRFPFVKAMLSAAFAFICASGSSLSSTAEAAVLLETNFSNTTLYPAGKAMGSVPDGSGAWSFTGTARAMDLSDETRGIRMSGTGTNYYNFSNTYTSGTITIEFSFIPHVERSAFEIVLGNGTANGNIGPQLRFGHNADNEISYYNGSKFVTINDISFTVDQVNTFSITASLSGENAGTFDLYHNGELVAGGLVWRNLLTSLTNLRARSVSDGPNVDLLNLKITYDAVPEPSSVALVLTGLFGFGGLSRYISRKTGN